MLFFAAPGFIQDTPELRVFVEHLDMQLERLSDKMDSCFQEVLSLKRISGNSSNVQVGPTGRNFHDPMG